VVPVEDILLQDPKCAILLGWEIWYSGLTFIDFSILRDMEKDTRRAGYSDFFSRSSASFL